MPTSGRLLPYLFFALVLGACEDKAKPPFPVRRPDAGERTIEPFPLGATPSASTPAPPPSVSAPASASAAPSSASGPTDAGAAGDGGALAGCRRTFGPAEMPFRGPAAMRVDGDDLVLVLNDAGAPKLHTIPIPAVPPRSAPTPPAPPRPASFFSVSWPPCALAGKYTYCPGPGGRVVRSGPAGARKEVAKGRPGARIAAVALGDGHSLVAYLDERTTTEGKVLQAFAAFDEDPPVRLSDDGAGATSVALAPRGAGALAVYLDARTSMVPIHARPIRLAGGKLELQKDVVMAVGGPPERGVAAAIATTATGATFGLVPMAEDTLSFGMGVVKVGDPPREDTPILWSRYPNGLDPAPVVATTGATPTRVLRVRTAAKEPSAPRALELGRLDEQGAFTTDGLVEIGKPFLDLGLLVDPKGSVWILYGDASVAFLERRTCN